MAWLDISHAQPQHCGLQSCRDSHQCLQKCCRATQTWAKLGTSTGAKKKDVQRKLPRNCPSPRHQVGAPEGGSSTHRGLWEEVFENRYHMVRKRKSACGKLCIRTFSQHPVKHDNRPFLSKITHSSSFLHPAPGKTASCFQTFLNHFCNPSANTWSLSSPFSNTTRLHLIPERAASQILPEGSFEKRPSTFWAGAPGTSWSLLQLDRSCKTQAAIFPLPTLFYGYTNFVAGPIWWRQYTDAESLLPVALKSLHWLIKRFSAYSRHTARSTASTHKAFTGLRNTILKSIFAFESLRQHSGTENGASMSINRSSYLFTF